MKKERPKKEIFDIDNIIASEDRFIEAFIEEEKGKKLRPLRLLFKLYKGHYLRLLFAIFIYIIKDSPIWVLPLITADVINVVTTPPENVFSRLLIDFILALALLVFNIPLHTLFAQILSRANHNVEAGLRGAMIRKLQQLTISFHKDTQSGKIQSKIMRDVEVITDLSGILFNTILGAMLNVGVTLFIVISKNIYIFLMFLLMIPAAVFLQIKFRDKIYDKSRSLRKEIENTSAAVYDMEELIPVTRAHSLEKTEVKKLTTAVTKIAKKGHDASFVFSFFGSMNWALTNIFQILCLIITSIMAYKKMMSIGEISLYQSYFATLSAHVINIISLLPSISRGTDAIHSVSEIISAGDVEENIGKPELKNLEGKYEFKNVSFDYDNQTHVLKNLDLTVNAGETIALVGESGSGKSTIINLVVGFNTAESGQLLIDGKDITSFDMRSYRKMISVVPQSPILFSGTVRENITYGSDDYTEEQLNYAIKAARLEDVIAKLPNGLDTSVGEHGAKLSGGQRQRITIARAIIRDPKVIIFDEATSALDSVTEREIQAAIENLTRDRTTFMVAHRLSTIKNADKIAVIKDGKCVEMGTYDELVAKKGEFYAFKQIQS